MKAIKLGFQDGLFNISWKDICKIYSSMLILQQNIAKITSLFYPLKSNRDYVVK